MRYSKCLFIFLFCVSAVLGNETSHLADYENKLKRLLDDGIRSFLPMIMKSAGEVEISSECLGTGLRMVRGIRELKEWAIKMLDATAKPQSGILDGTAASFGDYDECLSIKSDEDVNGEPIVGQYCRTMLDFPEILKLKPTRVLRNYSLISEFEKSDTVFREFLKFRELTTHAQSILGICVPSSCSAEDISLLLNHIGSIIDVKATVECEVKKPTEWTVTQISIAAFLCLMLLASTAGTIVDLTKRNWQRQKSSKKSFAETFLLSFSVYTNTKKMFKRRSGKFDFLAGMRMLTITWIVLGHTYTFISPVFLHQRARLTDFIDAKYNIFTSVVGNPTPSVSTFFVISGMLIAHLNGPRLAKGNLMYVVTFLGSRLLRILPAMGLTIGLFLLLPLFGSGPLWKPLVMPEIAHCETYSWRNFLLISNFWRIEEMCLLHTWFLAVLWQLTLLSVILVTLIYRKPCLGISLVVVLTVATFVIVGVMNNLYNYPPTIAFSTFDGDSYNGVLSNIYLLPSCHLGAFVVGILAGYFLYVKEQLKLSKMALGIGWTLCAVTSFVIIHGLHNFPELYQGTTYSIVSAVYAALHRAVWSLCVAWVCVVCASGHGGIVTKLLSSSIFVPLDKLTFFIYLLHPVVMFYCFGVVRETRAFSHLDTFFSFFGFTILTVILSYLCHVIVENPLGALDGLLFRKKRPEKEAIKAEDPGHMVTIISLNHLENNFKPNL